MVPLLPLDAPVLPTLSGLAIEPEEARSILRPQRDEAYGFGLSLSPYRGCGFGCRYCYLRGYPHGPHAASEWGSWVAPKLNAPELIWRERHRLVGNTVFLSTGTDPYQPVEKHLGLTRQCLQVLLDCPGARVKLHTRSPLVTRDIDLLQAFGSRLSVGISIPTDDDTVRQVLEPRAPAIPSRWATVERLTRAGIRVTVAATPLLPMADPEGYGRQLRASGASQVWVGGLRLLKDDPMHDVLATHGWLRILQRDHVRAMAELLEGCLPSSAKAQRRRGLRTSAPVRTLVQNHGVQRPLFESL